MKSKRNIGCTVSLRIRSLLALTLAGCMSAYAQAPAGRFVGTVTGISGTTFDRERSSMNWNVKGKI